MATEPMIEPLLGSALRDRGRPTGVHGPEDLYAELIWILCEGSLSTQ